MAKVGAVRFNIEANSSRMSRDLAAANKKLARFRGQTKLNMDQIRNSFVSAFGGFIVLNAVTSSIKKMAAFELQMDKVNAISGATDRQMKALTETALRLGRTTIFTAGEIGKMEEELARLGFSSEKILAAADAISKLALVTGSELGEAAKTMAGTLNGFNLEADESGRVANVMAESFAKSALTMEKFTVGTANSSAIARVFGASVEANTARLGKLVDANIDASKAGTDLRKIYIELNANGLTYDEGMQKIAQSTDKIKTSTELFGIRASGAAVILSELQGSVKHLTGELKDANEEIDDMALIMGENLATDIKILTSAYDGFILKMREANGLVGTLVQHETNLVNIISSDNATKMQMFWALVSPSHEQLAQIALAVENLDRLDKMKADLISIEDRTTIEAIAQEQYAKALDKTKEGLEAMMQPISFHRLQEEIRTELLKTIAKAEEDHLEVINKKIAAYKEAAKAAFLAGKAEEYASAGIKSKGIADFLAKNKEGADAEKRGTFAGLNTSIFDGGAANLDIAGGAADASAKSLEKKKKLQQKYVDATMQQAAGLQQGMESLVQTFVSSIGQEDGIERAFASIVGQMGDGLIKLGTAAVAYAAVMTTIGEALKAGLAAPALGFAGGLAAIAAGVALKAASHDISSNMAGGGGGGSGSASGPSGSFIGGAANQQRIEGEFTVRGSDLVYVLGRQGRLDGRQKAG
tara:strand:- start:597 stop:2699 length:2103 start_codon:yes stop_codon:yes gene_type:complete